jgi:hypothetical protein
MSLLVVIAAIFVAMLGLWAMARNATTVCVLEIQKGKVVVTRGNLAPRVLGDIRDVVSRPKVRHATLRISRSRGHAEVDMHGELSPEQRQRLRNVIGNVPLAKLETGRARKKR